MEHIIERAVLRVGGRAITGEMLTIGQTEASEESGENALQKLLDLPYRASIQAWERLLIDRALKQANGNKAEAARLLGIHRRLLYEKLEPKAN